MFSVGFGRFGDNTEVGNKTSSKDPPAKLRDEYLRMSTWGGGGGGGDGKASELVTRRSLAQLLLGALNFFF